MKLNLLENAIHSFRYALVHLDVSNQNWSPSDDEENNERHEAGYFSGDLYSIAPPQYELKFTILHLIQALELLLKHDINRREPGAIFLPGPAVKTINLAKAIKKTIEARPELLSTEHVSILFAAANIRNTIEHYQFEVSEREIRLLIAEFCAIFALLVQAIENQSLMDVISWNSLRAAPDPLGDTLRSLLSELGAVGRAALVAAVQYRQREGERLIACLSCGTRSFSLETKFCLACGDDDEEASILAEDLTLVGDMLQRLEKFRPRR